MHECRRYKALALQKKKRPTMYERCINCERYNELSTCCQECHKLVMPDVTTIAHLVTICSALPSMLLCLKRTL
jgi:hypothetical protein